MKKLLALLCLASVFAFPAFSSAALSEDADLAKLFEARGVNGTLVIAALDDAAVFVHNLSRAEQRFLPASTFKIPNTLIALDAGAIRDDKEAIAWDGTDKGWEQWNRDQTLETAFPLSCVWFYQELAKRIGNDRYLKQLEKIGYGNEKTGPDLTTFWLEGDLEISPMEQIAFLKKLYVESLPFSVEHMRLVKRLMIVDETPAYILRAKTGWAMRTQPQIGWYVGYVETRGKVWFFANNYDIAKKGDEKYRKELVVEGFRIKGIL